ncbi:antitoxin MazE family protein [Marinibaculum pumilum]|uniref:Antitoxin MazE family protein n=1 Tax=Marinibaculum pumilum TaxID=1766165 RepID=A0ABV7L0Y8_9PROT
MAGASASRPSRTKVGAHRARLRAQGLRPIQIWVPDVRAPSFRTEAHRQAAAVAASSQAQDDQAFIDAVSDPDTLADPEDSPDRDKG